MTTFTPVQKTRQVVSGWQQRFHSFSFEPYCDPRHIGRGVLRVINEDDVVTGQGFGTHPHRKQEVLSDVVVGTWTLI